MKSLYKSFFWWCVFLAGMQVQAIDVKVLLACEPVGEELTGEFEIGSPKGFEFKDPITKNSLKMSNSLKNLLLECRIDGVYLDGKRLFKQKLIFEPVSGVATYAGHKYKGYFLIQKINDKYALINVVPLEDYVLSVLKTESWPGWPLEINKVMAIIARSYCLHQIMLSYQKKLPYHIRNTNHHQTYKGVHTCAVSKKAVEETKGLFVAYGQAPILAMFDCCCGGVIPAHIEGMIDFKKAPYLGRDYACTYCEHAKSFKWTTTYSLDDFMTMLQDDAPFIIHSIRDVKIAQKDRAGLVQKVVIKTSTEPILLNADKMYRLSSRIKSFSFSVVKKGKKIVFKGKGFGHHMGLCQWGAREMVRRGFTYQNILPFYYPGTTLMRFVDSTEPTKEKGGVCQDIKGILSEVQLRSLA